jgi:hypothetical protein
MAESLTISATLLFKSTETGVNKDRMALIACSLMSRFATTNDNKCVFTHPDNTGAIQGASLFEVRSGLTLLGTPTTPLRKIAVVLASSRNWFFTVLTQN